MSLHHVTSTALILPPLSSTEVETLRGRFFAPRTSLHGKRSRLSTFQRQLDRRPSGHQYTLRRTFQALGQDGQAEAQAPSPILPAAQTTALPPLAEQSGRERDRTTLATTASDDAINPGSKRHHNRRGSRSSVSVGGTATQPKANFTSTRDWEIPGLENYPAFPIAKFRYHRLTATERHIIEQSPPNNEASGIQVSSEDLPQTYPSSTNSGQSSRQLTSRALPSSPASRTTTRADVQRSDNKSTATQNPSLAQQSSTATDSRPQRSRTTSRIHTALQTPRVTSQSQRTSARIQQCAMQARYGSSKKISGRWIPRALLNENMEGVTSAQRIWEEMQCQMDPEQATEAARRGDEHILLEVQRIKADIIADREENFKRENGKPAKSANMVIAKRKPKAQETQKAKKQIVGIKKRRVDTSRE